MAADTPPIPAPPNADLLDVEDDDPFNPVSTAQNLESSYYAEGHALGRADGTRAGRVEGRVFGLEKGFDKFFAMGRVGGRAAVWGARLESRDAVEEAKVDREEEAGQLAPLRQHPRLAGYVTTLHALAEAASLETRNTEDGVADFDDRFRRAEAKAKVIERVVAEPLDGGGLEAAGGGEDGDKDGAEAEAETEPTHEDFAVEVTMGDVDVRLRKEREMEGRQQLNEPEPATTKSAPSTKRPPPSKAPKRAGVKVASDRSRARGGGGGGGGGGGEKNMEDFGIGEARALGRLL